MTIHELCVALQSQEPEHDVFVALYVDDTAELFHIPPDLVVERARCSLKAS